MSFSLFQFRPQRPFATDWLVDVLPRYFDRALERLGWSHLKWSILLLLVISVPLVITPLKVWQQGVIAVVLLIIGQVVVRAESRVNDKEISEYYHLFLVWLSLVTTSRYLYYRLSYTLNFDGWLNGAFCVLLLFAELYAIMTLVLAYFQTLKIQDREPVDLSAFPQDRWFKVDIYIPTYNEDVDIVRKTVLGAVAIDYPADKKRVYILDDGRPERYKEDDPRREKFRLRRESLRQMCAEIGAILLTRDSNEHAKAGNINTAFRRTDGDLVMILDCDHIPTRQFLQHTVGFFFDPKVAFVQTPHWFFNPDPFERNLRTGGRIPVGNELFYKVLQKGNDYWNASFFCGSAAVIRKEYALQIGGIATETVTEDCHTAFRLHSLGYKSIYYDKIMVAGLAPETFSSYVGQQVRWARGMAQILRIENPVFNPKLNLSIPQRICYFSATSHFFYGYPRLMYAIAPTLFLLFRINPISGLGLETLAYALPHLLLSLNANYITYKNVRFSFWNEIFEFVMAFQAGYVTMMALINPQLGSFNVTDKDMTLIKREFSWQNFDWRSVQGLLGVSALVIIGLLSVPFWLILRPEDSQAVLVNAMWCVFNLILLLAALLVAFEQPQERTAHRLRRRLGATIYSYDYNSGQNQEWHGHTMDVSETGCRIMFQGQPNLPLEIELELVGDFGARAILEAEIVMIRSVGDEQTQLAVKFINLTQTQRDNLALVIYSDVKEWYSQRREFVDRPLESFGFLATGMFRVFQEFKVSQSNPNRLRKHIRAAAQIYWQGEFYLGYATELGTTSIKLELDNIATSNAKLLQPKNLERIKQEAPIVGLLLSQDLKSPSRERLLAQIISIQLLAAQEGSQSTPQKVAIELLFPEQFKDKQAGKIRELARTLR
ncbi:MAG TPA: cellulose synthase catalytic subunit (UDP-forming) [Cyanobacteria bacterium UBA8803]|nr:cellulose synthase catalytic subunit (UDP-forming) [Cyanobacteria bacterium UBA9273]HBL57569.1 cellulose synthase catalytic subunit (UDP-forming) [Cyanobacteria bacterium UBA8803]